MKRGLLGIKRGFLSIQRGARIKDPKRRRRRYGSWVVVDCQLEGEDVGGRGGIKDEEVVKEEAVKRRGR